MLPTNTIASTAIREVGASPTHPANKEIKMINIIGWITVIYFLGCWISGIGYLLLHPEELKDMFNTWIDIPLFLLVFPLLVIAELVERLIKRREK
jgi:hypothetical protein